MYATKICVFNDHFILYSQNNLNVYTLYIIITSKKKIACSSLTAVQRHWYALSHKDMLRQNETKWNKEKIKLIFF